MGKKNRTGYPYLSVSLESQLACTEEVGLSRGPGHNSTQRAGKGGGGGAWVRREPFTFLFHF